MLKPYSPQTERLMKTVYDSLSEKGKRLYAAIEAQKLPRGGVNYIAKLLGCDRKTVNRGLKELNSPVKPQPPGKIRRKGGGRPPVILDEINEAFLDVLRNHTAGDPMNGNILWTDLTPGEIREKLAKKGIHIGENIVKQLLRRNNYKKRKAYKMLSTGSYVYRDEQFNIINRLRIKYEKTGNPIISVDTKKKEHLGNLYREGRLYTKEIIKVFDHDFPHLASGTVIPYTVYDVQKNSAFVNIGTSKDTAEFACDSIKEWWCGQGRRDYPNASSILVFADSGGSNSYRHYVFKEQLQKLVDEIGIEIRMAHYPPYASKWNPVEHRVFPHITRALQGVVFTGYDVVRQLINKAKTKTGLTVTAKVTDKVYETGKKAAEGFKESMRIIFDGFLGKLNYRAIPLKS